MSLSDNRNNSLSNPQPIPLNYVVKSEPTLHIEDCYESRIPNGEEFLIEIHYKSAKALKHQVTNRQGCHLYYQNVVEDENDGAFGPMSADQIPFPDFNEFCMSEKQTDLTMTLLRHMEKGLLLHCQDGNMYLTRYGRTVIFWNTSQNENQEPEKSRRGELVKIFDYRKFRAEITDCLGKLGPCPPAPQIYLGIGQQWSSKCPLKNNLVSVLVTPLKAMEEYISIATR
uniref:Interferon regulatory factor 5-like n=1 Tax=Saccoglossus kowalevskii TaxID=10224 RepID=A0ABM0LZ18_SACKO|nr:PREDICTED: interferon regulatory factor 5-like [Saccoglossus kowalevskii]